MFVIQFHHIQDVMKMSFHEKNKYWHFVLKTAFLAAFCCHSTEVLFWLIVLVILSELGWYQGHSVPVGLSCFLLIHGLIPRCFDPSARVDSITGTGL